MNDYSQFLSQFDNEFEQTEVNTQQSFDSIPPGKYQVKIDRIELKTSKNNNLMLCYALKILNGNYVGRFLFKNSIITNDTIKWLKQDISICNIKISKLSELQSHLQDFLDIKLEVTKKINGEYENIYFNRKITINEMDYDKTYIPDDDIPF